MTGTLLSGNGSLCEVLGLYARAAFSLITESRNREIAALRTDRSRYDRIGLFPIRIGQLFLCMDLFHDLTPDLLLVGLVVLIEIIVESGPYGSRIIRRKSYEPEVVVL